MFSIRNVFFFFFDFVYISQPAHLVDWLSIMSLGHQHPLVSFWQHRSSQYAAHTLPSKTNQILLIVTHYHSVLIALIECHSRKTGQLPCPLARRFLCIEHRRSSPKIIRLLKVPCHVLTGWHRRTSSPWKGSRRLALGTAGGPLWHELHSRTSSLPLLLTLLFCQCWPPSSAAPPVSWLVQCLLCYCSP